MATHSSIKDPMAKVYLLVSLVFILAAVFYLVSSLISTIGRNSIKGEIDTDSLMANKSAMIQSVIEPVGSVTTSDGSGAVAAGPSRSGEAVYTAVCLACHSTGAAGAPKIDDKAAWEPRVANGFESMMEVAINGKGAMPARGGQNVPDEELQAAIVYMTTKAGFNVAPKVAPKAAPKAVEKPVPKADSSEKAAIDQKNEQKETAEKKVIESKKVDEAEKSKSGFSPAAEEAAPTKTKAVAPAPETSSAASVTESTMESTTESTMESTTAPTVATAAPAVKQVSSISGEKIYKSTCFACHDMGVAGAPKVGDKALWESRIAAGNAVMYASAINGKQSSVGVMPPKGGNLSLSDDETKAAVDYMMSQSQ